MSYTTFDVATENAAWKPDAEPKTITVTVKVTNTGSCAGKEVVQIYAACPFGKLKKERKRLVAFGKTALLQPGESDAQIYGKYNTVPYDKLKLDLFYIENYSLWMELETDSYESKKPF